MSLPLILVTGSEHRATPVQLERAQQFTAPDESLTDEIEGQVYTCALGAALDALGRLDAAGTGFFAGLGVLKRAGLLHHTGHLDMMVRVGGYWWEDDHGDLVWVQIRSGLE